MKPIYSFNSELQCINIQYDDRIYFLDYPDFCKILNNDKKFKFEQFEGEDYPSFLSNKKRIGYLQFIFDGNINCIFSFKNNNMYDLRRSNVFYR
jgi:hypothetical protein